MTTTGRPRKGAAAKTAAPTKKAAAATKKTATAKKAAAPKKAPAKKAVAKKPVVTIDLTEVEEMTEIAIDGAELGGESVAAPPPPAAKGKRGPFAALNALQESVGEVSLMPLYLLLGLSAVERFDAIAFGVLSPELQKTFHLNDAKLASISGLTAAVPILFSVPLGALADRVNRVRLSMFAALIWGGTAVITGLAPVLAIFILARLLGGVGLLINEPVHPSLLSDYYPPQSLTRVNSWHRQAGTIGLIGGPLAGVLGSAIGWRATFVILAIPTFILASMLTRLTEPKRGATTGFFATDEKAPSIREAFKRIRAIKSLRRTWVSAVFFGSGTLPFATFLNLYLKHVFDLSPFARGMATAVFGGAGAIGLAMSTKVVNKFMATKGLRALPLVSGGMVFTLGVGILLMAGAPNFPIFIVFSIIGGIGATGFLPPYLTLVAFGTPAALRSQTFSWSLLFYALGALVFSPIVGSIADQHGERVAFVLLSVLVMIGGLIAMTVQKTVEADVANAQQA
jgi:MFS family permease